jgi:hypothetical protein
LEKLFRKTQGVPNFVFDILSSIEYFVELAKFFNHEYQIRFNDDKHRLLHEYLPQLIDGILSALTHDIIHLGFALKSPSPQSIGDALAYMVFSYRSLSHLEASSSTYEPIDPSEGCRELIDLLEFVRQDILSLIKQSNEKTLSDLLGDDEHYHFLLQEYAKRITSIERVKDEHLHPHPGWALRECLQYFNNERAQVLRIALYDYIMTVLCVYLSQHVPEIRLREVDNSNKSRVEYIRKIGYFIFI